MAEPFSWENWRKVYLHKKKKNELLLNDMD